LKNKENYDVKGKIDSLRELSTGAVKRYRKNILKFCFIELVCLKLKCKFNQL